MYLRNFLAQDNQGQTYECGVAWTQWSESFTAVAREVAPETDQRCIIASGYVAWGNEISSTKQLVAEFDKEADRQGVCGLKIPEKYLDAIDLDQERDRQWNSYLTGLGWDERNRNSFFERANRPVSVSRDFTRPDRRISYSLNYSCGSYFAKIEEGNSSEYLTHHSGGNLYPSADELIDALEANFEGRGYHYEIPEGTKNHFRYDCQWVETIREMGYPTLEEMDSFLHYADRFQKGSDLDR